MGADLRLRSGEGTEDLMWRAGGATAPNLGNRRGMRGAHLAQPCLVGLKLRFARRLMPAQGLRPPPRRIGKAAPQHGKT